MPPPVPQHLCDRAELLARAHPLNVVAEIIGICPDTMTDIRKRGWKAAPAGRRMRSAPSDFSIQVRHMTARQLAAHYAAGHNTVSRWRREVAR